MSKNTDLGNLVNGLFVSSTRNVGIGMSTPANAVVVDKGTATASYLQFTAGTTTGQLATDGFEVGIDASGNGIISQQENLPLMIYTNSAERMRITAAGNVGIGTSTPNYTATNRTTLDINGATECLLAFSNGGTSRGYIYHTATDNIIWAEGARNMQFGIAGAGFMGFGTNNTERMRITSGGRILMGGTSDNGLGTLQVFHPTGGAGLFLRNGSDLVLEPAVQPNNNAGFYNDYGSLQAFVGGATGAYCNGTTWINGSDERLKKDINTITFNGLDAISLLRPVSYKLISDEKEKERIGFIAQEIQEVLPQVVDDSSGEHLGVDYGSITAALVKAIQELSAEVQLLKNK